MAPVAERRNTWLLFLAMLLCASAIFAVGFTSSCGMCRATQIYPELKGYTLYATLVLFNTTLDISYEDLQTLQESYKYAQQGETADSYDVLADKGLDLDGLFGKTKRETVYLENAEIYFYYYQTTYDEAQQKSISTRIYIDDCSPSLTNASGVANCTIPEEVYRDKCNMVYASFCDPEKPSDICEKAKPSTAQTYICGEKSDAISRLSSIISGNLQTLSAPMCFVSMILGGLLLASMFFSGRSPLSLLDITTPLLPKAKSISYGGISMGTGITRTGRAADMMTKEIEKSSGATIHGLSKFYRSSTGYNRRLLDTILASGASNSLKMIAIRAAINGMGQREVERILGLKSKNLEDQMKELGPLISSIKAKPNAELNKLNNLDDAVISLAEKKMIIEMQKDAFWRATGQVPKGLTGKLKQTAGNLPVIGDHIRGGWASAFFAVRQTGKLYGAFAKGVARTAIGKQEVDRIQMVVDAKRANKKPVSLFEGMVALSEEERRLVSLFNIYEKGDALYKRKMQEAKNDILNWLLRKLLEKYGAALDLNEEQVMQIGFKEARELMFASLKAKEFGRIEAELRKILSSSYSEYQKAALLMALMSREGVDFDRASVQAAILVLQSIEKQTPPSYRPSADGYFNQDAVMNTHRLIRLQKYMEDQFRVNQRVDISSFGNNFFFTTGRADLKYDSVDHRFSTFFLSNYRQQLEKAAKPGEKPISFMDVANYCFLRVVNERWGLIDPNTAGLSTEVKLVMQKAREWLLSLVNPGIYSGTPSMDELLKGQLKDGKRVGGLYAPDTREGVSPGKDALWAGSHGFEYGPLKGTWRMDMKAHWRVFGTTIGGAKTSVENQSYKEVYDAHTMPAGVRSIIDAYKANNRYISQKEAMDEYLKQVVARNLFERMKGIIELNAPNAYFSSQREFDYFHSILASYKEYIARKQNRKEYDITDREVEKFIRSPMGIKEIGEDSWIRLREGAWVPFSQKNSFKLAQADRVVNSMAYVKQDGIWKEFKPEKHFTDGLFRKRVRMLGEFGDITPANNEVLKRYSTLLESLKAGTATKGEVDAFIQTIAGFAAREGRDSRKGDAYASLLLRLFYDPSKAGAEVRAKLEAMGVTIDRRNPNLAGTGFGEAVEANILARTYAEPASAEERRRAADSLKEWARGGSPQDNRQLRLVLFFYSQAGKTNDWKDFNSYEDGIRIAPVGTKSFTTEVGGRQVLEEAGGVRNWLRQVFKPLHMELEQFLMSSFAQQTKAQYESSLVSEYFRETGAKFAGKLLAGEFGTNLRDRNDPAIKAYNELADAFGKYHAMWDETITRDPRGNSSAIGHSFIFSSFFHHGPAMPFGPGPYRRWTTPGFNKAWYSGERLTEGFKSLQWTPQMFNWMLAAPFIASYRTFLTSKLGYPSKYDRNYIQPDVQAKNREYELQMQRYNAAISEKAHRFEQEGLRPDQAWGRARDESRSLVPEAPSFTLQRDTLTPYSMSEPRNRDAWRSFTNWFYASFDPTSTNWKRNFARLVSPVTAFIPSAKLHGMLLDQEWHFADSFRNPYYVSPGGFRGEMIKRGGPMIKRQYGGTEMLTGVVRAPEDMWAFQAGVNVVWGNANPGASYIDFSNTLQMDPRAANHLRYESRYRPYFEHDKYIEKQANLGIAKREIDPTRMMLERNAELRQYRFPENTLYAFLSPATLLGYRAASWAKRAKSFAGDIHDFAEGLATYDGSNRGIKVYGGYGLARGMQFEENFWSKQKLKFKTEIRYCSCGSAMPADGVCPACSKKMRCVHCNSLVNPAQTHTCQHGLRRNILMDEMQQSGVWNGINIWRNTSRIWGRNP